MVNVLDFALGVLIVASLATIIVYAIILLSVTAWTALRGSRHDPRRRISTPSWPSSGHSKGRPLRSRHPSLSQVFVSAAVPAR